MKSEEREEVLKVISQVQESTARVSVQIGGVSDNTGIVEDDTLYITHCPPRLINELTDMGYSLNMADGKLQVR